MVMLVFGTHIGILYVNLGLYVTMESYVTMELYLFVVVELSCQ